MLYERIIRRKDMVDCMLCYDAPCGKVCDQIEVDKTLRSIYFDNEKIAAYRLPENNPCLNCDGKCEKACLNGKVEIKKLINRLYDEIKPELEVEFSGNEDKLKTDFCGIPIENPFFVSSSVVSSTYDMCAAAFEAGFAGIAYKTICNFEIHEASPRFSAVSGNDGSIIGFKNIEQLSIHSNEEDMEIFRRLKKNYPNKFILASIMGTDDNEWIRLAKMCEENGADALELNFSCPNLIEGGLGSDIGQVPELVGRYTRDVTQAVKIPVIAKLTPNVAEMSPAAFMAKTGGADGIAAINTVKSVTNVNIHTYVSSPAVHGMSAVGGYSGKAVKPIALRFISEIAQNEGFDELHISGMGGIETWRDAAEFMFLGANTVQLTTAIMQYGLRIIDDLKSGLLYYLDEKGFESVEEIDGLGLSSLSMTTDTLERGTILFPAFEKDKCLGCGRCELSCKDGGHQAITLDENRRPVLNGQKCVGCHLCILVCPNGAIRPAKKRIRKN